MEVDLYKGKAFVTVAVKSPFRETVLFHGDIFARKHAPLEQEHAHIVYLVFESEKHYCDYGEHAPA